MWAEVGSGSQRATQIGGNSASFTRAFPGNVTAGSLLVVGGSGWQSGATGPMSPTVTDSLGTVYTVVETVASAQLSGKASAFIAYGIAPSSGANTVTVTAGSAWWQSFSIDEFSGIDTTTPLKDTGRDYSSDFADTPVAAIADTTTLEWTLGAARNWLAKAVAFNAADGSAALVVGVLYYAYPNTTITPATGTQIGEQEDNGASNAHSLTYITSTASATLARISAAPVLALATGDGSARLSAAPVLALVDQRPPARVSAAPLLVLMPSAAAVEASFTDGEVSNPVAWAELTDKGGTLRPYAEVDLNDGPNYYGGYKAPKVLGWSRVSRGLSDRTGQVEHQAFGLTLTDTDRELRGLLDHESLRYLTNRPIVQRMIDDELRRVEGIPRIFANGYISDYSPDKNLTFKLTGSDWLKKKFSRRRAADQGWQPLIELADFALCPTETLGKAAPIIYGRISDETDPADVVSPDLYPRDSTDYGWLALGYNHLAAAGPAAGNYCAYVTAIKNGVESMVTPFMVGFYLDGSQQAYIYFDTSTTPDLYRVYFSDGRDVFHPFSNPMGGTFARYQDFAPGGLVTDPYGTGSTNKFVLIDGVTWGSDYRALITGTTTSATLTPSRGLVPTLYVGTETFAGDTWSAFLVARHACKEIEGVYAGKVRQSSLGLSTNLLAPHLTADYAATFGADYREINGKRFTLIYARGSIALAAIDGTAPLTVNVKGVEDVGDGSGALLENLVDQYEHFVRNYLAPDDPAATDWLTGSPEFPHIAGLTLIDEASFDTVRTTAEARVPGGMTGAGIIGNSGELESALDIIAAFNVSLDCDSGFNRKGQYRISMEPSNISDVVDTLDDVVQIVDGSFTVTDQVTSEFFNILPYRHTLDHTGEEEGGWFSGPTDLEVSDTDSITNYDQARAHSTFELRFLRSTITNGAATIANVMQRKLWRLRHPVRRVTLALSLQGLSYDLGEQFKVTHIEGIGASGWTGHRVRVKRHEVDAESNTVYFDCYDLEQIFSIEPYFVLGARASLGSTTWNTATIDQQMYGYLASRSTGEFSDGHPAKKLRSRP